MAPLPAAGCSSSCLRGCDFFGEGWQERGALSRFGADWPGKELRTAQSPEPAAGSLAPLILPEKRERLVGAATPGGVGRGGGERADPKARTGVAGRGRARAESRTPHRSRSLGESGTPSRFRQELHWRCPRPPHRAPKGNAKGTFKPGFRGDDESGEPNRTETWMDRRAGRDSFLHRSAGGSSN